MKRIYVCGAYSADNVITVLDNMRKGMRIATEVLLAGYAPFCPWHDYHFQLMLQGVEKLSVEDYYEYSIAWLPVCDAVLLVPGYESSVGTKNEIAVAGSLKIPVFVTLEDLSLFFKA